MADTPRITPNLDAITPGPKSVTGQAQNPPGQQLSAGTVLHGAVSGNDGDGNTIIKTDALRLVLKTDFPLKKGVDITLRLEQSVQPQAEPRVRITHINGQTAQHWQVSQGQTANMARTSLPAGSASGGVILPESTQAGADKSTQPPQPADARGQIAQQQAQAPQTQRPIGVLLEMTPRGQATQNADGQPAPVATQAQQSAPSAPRAAATQVQITPQEARSMQAVLLRPEASPTIPKAVQAALPQAMAPSQLPASAMPTGQIPPAAQWLKPGLQLTVQVVSAQPPATPAAAPQTLTTQVPPVNVSATSPQTPAPGAQSPMTPTTTAPDTGMPPQAPQTRSGYAAYAQSSGTGAPAPTTPPANPPVATPTAQPTPSNTTGSPVPSTPTGGNITPPPSAGAPATQAPPTTHSAAPLSGQHVTQLLQQASTQPLPPGQMPAIVVGQEKSGAMIVQTQLGTFSLPQLPQAASQPGSVLQLDVQSVQLPDGRAATRLPLPLETGGAVATAAQMTQEGSALFELASTLQQMQGAQAAQALQRVVPHIGNNMTAGMVFFLSVVRKGDVSQWLGRDVIHQLEQMGKGELVQRLGADLAALRTVWEQPAAQPQQTQTNWQALFMPVMADKELQQARLFVKPDGGQDGAEGGRGTRFVVELDLSNLGPMQLDGLVKKRGEQKSFDLVIRTLQPLDEQIQTDVENIYYQSQEAIGFTGKVHFRQEVEFPIKPLEEMPIDASPDGDHGSILA